MRSRFLKSLLPLILLAQVTPAFGNEIKTFPCGGGASYSVTMPAGVLTDGRQCAGAVSIDSTVKSIGVEAFKDSKITSIVLPDSIELISTGAFENTQLRSVVIPKSVQIIGESAFAYNNLLTEAEIPDTVLSIRARAFNGSPLKTIRIPVSLTKIESCSFGNMGFGEGSRTVVIPPLVTSIEGCAFWNSGITNLSLPNSLKTLEGFNRNKLSVVTIPNSVTTIGVRAFSDNPLLSVEIPNSVTVISEYAFANTFLSEVTLPNSIKTIREGAFANNPRLKSISMPDDLEVLGKDVFLNSPLLQTINYCGGLTGFPVTPYCPPERREAIEKERAEKAAAELKAKQEAEAKARAEAEARAKLEAEARAKSEAQAKARAELIGKLNVLKVQLDVLEGRLRKEDVTNWLQPLRAKVDDFVKELAEFSGVEYGPFQERLTLLSTEYSSLVGLAKPPVNSRVTTITCVKGKLTKKVTRVNPKCPKGYKKR